MRPHRDRRPPAVSGITVEEDAGRLFGSMYGKTGILRGPG